MSTRIRCPVPHQKTLSRALCWCSVVLPPPLRHDRRQKHFTHCRWGDLTVRAVTATWTTDLCAKTSDEPPGWLATTSQSIRRSFTKSLDGSEARTTFPCRLGRDVSQGQRRQVIVLSEGLLHFFHLVGFVSSSAATGCLRCPSWVRTGLEQYSWALEIQKALNPL